MSLVLNVSKFSIGCCSALNKRNISKVLHLGLINVSLSSCISSFVEHLSILVWGVALVEVTACFCSQREVE